MTANPFAGEVHRSAGHIPVWCDSPPNRSRPGMSGKYGTDRMPVAATT